MRTRRKWQGLIAAGDLPAELARIVGLDTDALCSLWLRLTGSSPSRQLSGDLLRRMVMRHVLEECLGGLDRKLAATTALLAGLFYDDRGNRLTPSHTNKPGQRYRCYVSQAVLQNDRNAVGSVTRVAAPDLEAAVIAAVRMQGGIDAAVSDRDLVAFHVRSIVLGKGRLDIDIFSDIATEIPASNSAFELLDASDPRDDSIRSIRRLTVSWTPRDLHRAKGVRDDGQPGLSDAARHQLLLAIAKARRWMRDVACDATNFAAIAQREGCCERHVRFLAPLAFLSPDVIAAIHDGRALSNPTISTLARCLPKAWVAQHVQILA